MVNYFLDELLGIFEVNKQFFCFQVLSADEKYQKAFTVCSQLALIISKGTITAFYIRIDQLHELSAAWTNENCTNHQSPNETCHMQTVRDIKSEADADLYRKSNECSTKPTVPNNNERRESMKWVSSVCQKLTKLSIYSNGGFTATTDKCIDWWFSSLFFSVNHRPQCLFPLNFVSWIHRSLF